MPPRAVLGLSHTPLLGLNPLAADVEADLRGALARARALVRAFAPELIVLFFPDHFNGFFHEVMPAVCVGTEGAAVGDYGTPAGPVSVAAADALALATHLIDQEFDIAVSRRMRFDHGVAQPLDLLFGGLAAPPIVPVFINGAGPPAIVRAGRAIRLGQAVGRHFADDPRRILFLGSGGLSHDPPIPTLDHPDAALRERIIARFEPTPEQRAQRQARVIQAGRDLAAGTSDRKPLNPAWDTRIMDRLEQADWPALAALAEDEIVRAGGGSAHETKNWIAAFAAASGAALTTRERWYRAIPELIAGFGVMYREGA
ncbi:MAG: 3-carboxyethylcatechol 2,3-dioxygenase [Burkholderiales bacterium]|nr:3-carboxyethylcatechol 2,3-dioxygenase [Burkholderiales bacterium]